MGVVKRGGDQLALVHPSRGMYRRPNERQIYAIPDRRTGHLFLLFVTRLVYSGTNTGHLDQVRARSKIHKISSNAFPFCAHTAPAPHCEEQDTEGPNTESGKAALLAAVCFCRSRRKKPPKSKKGLAQESVAVAGSSWEGTNAWRGLKTRWGHLEGTLHLHPTLPLLMLKSRQS